MGFGNRFDQLFWACRVGGVGIEGVAGCRGLWSLPLRFAVFRVGSPKGRCKYIPVRLFPAIHGLQHPLVESNAVIKRDRVWLLRGASQALQGRTCGRLLEQKCQSPAIFKQPLLQRPPDTGRTVSDKQKGLAVQPPSNQFRR